MTTFHRRSLFFKLVCILKIEAYLRTSTPINHFYFLLEWANCSHLNGELGIIVGTDIWWIASVEKSASILMIKLPAVWRQWNSKHPHSSQYHTKKRNAKKLIYISGFLQSHQTVNQLGWQNTGIEIIPTMTTFPSTRLALIKWLFNGIGRQIASVFNSSLKTSQAN